MDCVTSSRELAEKAAQEMASVYDSLELPISVGCNVDPVRGYLLHSMSNMTNLPESDDSDKAQDDEEDGL